MGLIERNIITLWIFIQLTEALRFARYEDDLRLRNLDLGKIVSCISETVFLNLRYFAGIMVK